MSNIASDWPVYVLIALMVGFFVFTIIKSKQEEKKNKNNQTKEKR